MGDEDWLSTWLQNLNLSEYWSNFVNNGYNSSELCCTILDKHELNRIGVGKVGHVNRLFRALEKLRADTGTRGRGENGLTGLEVSLEHPRQPDTGTLPTAHVVVEGESGRGGRKPPPVPTRKSTRRKTPSPTPSPTPPQCSSPEDGSGGRVTPEGGSSLPPPPVIPRQHSLRHQRGKPAARLRTSTGTSSMARPSHQELSPIPQSPVITNKQPGFPVPVSAGIQSPKHEVDQSAEHQNQCLAADAVSEISAERQRPSPVPRHKSSSPLERRGSGKPPPLPPPRVSSNPGVLATEETATLRPNGSIQDEVESVGVPASPVKVVSPEIARNPEERPPALPPKKYSPRSPQKQVIIPDGEVVFDLEDIPMPPTPANLNAPAGLDLPPLPPKDGRVPSFTPPPPPQGPLQDGLPSLPPKHTFGPPPFPPPTLPGRSPEPTLSRVNGRGGPPPAPPPRKSTLKPETTAPIEVSPVLPPKDGGAPPFSPPPPVSQASGEDWSASFVSSPPPVPPKSSASPPPPPPITPEDYPYEECSDSEGEGDAPLISISSKPGPEAAEDDTFLFLSASAREGSPSEDSDASPMHVPSRSAVIRQATADGDEIIMVGGSASERDGMRLEGGTDYLNNPGVDDTRDYENDDAVARAVNDLKDYENEDAIARAINDTKDYENDDAIARAINDLKDYENQDAIDRAIKEEEGGDFVNLSPVDGATRIRGLMPIRSKRAGEEGGPDYENQDVLDADIIPVASFPLAVGAGQVGAAPRLPRVQYENSEFQVPLPHVPPKPTTTEDRQLPQAVSPDRLTPNASGAHKPAQDFGCLSLDRGTRPPHSQQSGMLAPPNAPQSKPRSKTTLNAPTLDLAPGNAVYDTLEGVVASNGGVRPFPHSAPKAMGDYFDGGGVAQADLVYTHLHGNQVCSTQLALRCPMCVNPACGKMREFFTSQAL